MPGMYTQTRDLTQKLRARQEVVPLGTSPSGDWQTMYMPGSQVTTSFRSGQLADRLENESPDTNIRRRSQGGQSSDEDTGHEFYSRRDTFVGTSQVFRNWSTRANLISGYERIQDGPLIITEPNEFTKYCYPAVTGLAASNGPQLGAELIKRAMPTTPAASSVQAVTELLREGIRVPNLDFRPSAKTAKEAHRHASDAYLSLEFGWKPIVRDIDAIVTALSKANAIIKQYERDSGRDVRRRRGLPSSRSTQSFDRGPYLYNYGPHVGNVGWDARGTKATWTHTYLVNVWFSGSFTYFIPVPKGAVAKLERFEALANRVLGTRITAETVWELTSWSWLVDWVINVQDILSNAVAFSDDELVMKYGYLMRRTRINTILTQDYLLPPNKDGKRQVRTVANRWHTDVKERMRATPFGFGLTGADFTPRQWAILAALGFSRAPSSHYTD